MIKREEIAATAQRRYSHRNTVAVAVVVEGVNVTELVKVFVTVFGTRVVALAT